MNRREFLRRTIPVTLLAPKIPHFLKKYLVSNNEISNESIELLDIEKLVLEVTNLISELANYEPLVKGQITNKNLDSIKYALYYLPNCAKEGHVQKAISSLDFSKEKNRRNQEIALLLFLYILYNDNYSNRKNPSTLERLFDLGWKNPVADLWNKRKLLKIMKNHPYNPENTFMSRLFPDLLSEVKSYCKKIQSGIVFNDITKDPKILESLNQKMSSIYADLGSDL